jgi:hypothetical protein
MGNLATTLAHAQRADEAIALFEELRHNAAQAEGAALVEAHYQYAVGSHPRAVRCGIPASAGSRHARIQCHGAAHF